MTTKTVKLYIEKCDLKDRYKGATGKKRLRAYLKSVEKYTNVEIEVTEMEKEILGFAIVYSGPDRDHWVAEAKSNIQGEVCSAKAAKKFEESPMYLPSSHIKDKKVSREAVKEMKKEDQRRLQRAGVSPLTIDALEKHDRKHTTGPCGLRQFGCGACHHSWWRTVMKSKPVSRCRGHTCGGKRYDALPREREFGIGRCMCPTCDRVFFAYCEGSETLKCRKCKTNCKPHIHPKWRKKRTRSGVLNPNAASFSPSRNRPRRAPPVRENPGPQFMPVSEVGSFNVQELVSSLPEINHQRADRGRPEPRMKRRIFNASMAHTCTGSTVSTFLSQIDFDTESNMHEVMLDYDSEDDETPGPCKFECAECGNEYTVLVRMVDAAECYRCGTKNHPLQRTLGDIQKTSNAKHSCELCNGNPNCPNLA